MKNAPVLNFLRRAGLIGPDDLPDLEPLTGGVSSDIWKIGKNGEAVCVKRALPKLKTRKEWFAPVERNGNEAEWIRTAATIVPDAVPGILAEDPDAGMFAMDYLDPATHPVWKDQLRDGLIDTRTATAVGHVLGQIHSATADRSEIASRFSTDDIFFAIRIEPYLLRTAAECPDVSKQLKGLARITSSTKYTLVHGDVSPKNILAGPSGPVLLDAECAWHGDPAFDLAFCLNHMLLKCVWKPQHTEKLLNCFSALTTAYLSHVDWESAIDLERRTAALLPALMLARIDGASPVEYITSSEEKNTVRRAARRGLIDTPPTLTKMSRVFLEEVQK
ncbi:MAG: aminoglycoside phosphotransferase family protein [Pseudomonadota bacterium]|nr:aminoglycoside phosphotransferase family protein [Pseudomonadota bacterium]